MIEEWLMPYADIPIPPEVRDQTDRAYDARHIEYGAELLLKWKLISREEFDRLYALADSIRDKRLAIYSGPCTLQEMRGTHPGKPRP